MSTLKETAADWVEQFKQLPDSKKRELVAYLVASVAIVLALVAPLIAT